MNYTLFVLVLAGILVFLGGLAFFLLRGSAEQQGMENMVRYSGSVAQTRSRLADEATKNAEYNKITRRSRRRVRKRAKEKIPLDDQLYHAGIFSSQARDDYKRLQEVAPFVGMIAVVTLMWWLDSGLNMLVAGGVLGFMFGLQIPKSVLDRKTKARADDIMFYLPLVIEEISIGVSSSLDIGPCIKKVVSMAEDRGCHNVITELLTHVLALVKSGVALEDALEEIGEKAGHIEVKHTFTALGQVSKHGGEISKQLQELANAVSSQRETEIDAKIKKLELKATGPVALVFLAFIVIILIGFFIQIKKAFV